MTATERLRALLNERGVEHVDAEDGHTQHTWWSDGDHEIAASNSGERLAVYNLTPEQAVDATLGPGTCRDVRSEDDIIAFECSECGCWVAYDEYWETGIYIQGDGQQAHIHPRYCPNCGRKVVDR